jgi:hypothetical protein
MPEVGSPVTPANEQKRLSSILTNSQQKTRHDEGDCYEVLCTITVSDEHNSEGAAI